MALRYTDQPSLVTAFGFLIAIVAILGTQFFGWQWGTGQLVPTIIGIIVAGVAVLAVAQRVLG